MHKETVSKVTAAVLFEYVKIISDFFPGAHTIPEFIDAYNYVLPNYQFTKSKKMDPVPNFHCKLGLPENNTINYTHLCIQKNDQGEVLGYSMQITDEPDLRYIATTNVGTLTGSRINTFGIRKDRRALLISDGLDSDKNQIMRFVDKHDEYFNYLQYCFLKWQLAPV